MHAGGVLLDFRRYSIDKLKVAFRYYLDLHYPRSNEKTRQTQISDAFCLFRWMSEEEAWRCLELMTDPESGIHADLKRGLAETFLKNRKHPEKDAVAYLCKAERLAQFLKLAEMIDDARIRLPREIKITKE